jgi:hypothetical protein
MFAVKRLAVSVVLTLSLVLVTAEAAFAQVGPGNPSGGTACRQTAGSCLQLLPSASSVDVMLRSWLDTFIARRQTAAFSVTSWRAKFGAARVAAR